MRHSTTRLGALAGASALAAAVLAGTVLPTAGHAATTPELPAGFEHTVIDSAPDAGLAVTPIGQHREDVFDEGAAEIVQHHAATDTTLVVNAEQGVVQMIDAADTSAPTVRGILPTAGAAIAGGGTVPEGGVANSVAVRADGLTAIAVEAPVKTDDGWIVFYDVSGDEPVALGAVAAGALPDSVVFDETGSWAVVANEGEPAEDYSVDPEGSVGVIALPAELTAPTTEDVRIADFREFEEGGSLTLPEGIRIYGGREDATGEVPEFPVSENLEPEYAAILGDQAYVSLQEANGIAVVDLVSGEVTDIWDLGTQDLSQVPTDLTNEDDAYSPVTAPIETFRQPDTITTVNMAGTDYLLTANEGDSRDWDGYSEEIRISDFGQDGIAPLCETFVAEAGFDTVEELQDDFNLGRLKATTAQGLDEEAGCYSEVYGFGGRSFSVFNTSGELVFDSGNEFEELTARVLPEQFNANNDESGLDSRSDDKGPEPEAIETATIGDRTYAFIGFERVGGITVYDITDPAQATYQTYVNTRNFDVEVIEDDVANAGDSGPESIVYVTEREMLVVGNEVTGSTTYYDVQDLTTPAATPTEEETTTPVETTEPTETAAPTETTAPEETAPVEETTEETTSAAESTEDATAGEAVAEDSDGSLPVTGTQAGVIAGAGALLLGLGALALMAVRRRA
ncbi:choice-of-anchor I family protein [Brevibacterium litoralis]|uniref:choice-of-anchor I family protein n=1 Tax=Brevibacterium litoralis TaxID=3138935 RepID=UPI0032F02F3C